ncbi:helix-turn-helix domain-containing protein [Paraburkholderia fungorum]|nr:XRE family transcriptional regulator [Paraburkholderia fungorum]
MTQKSRTASILSALPAPSKKRSAARIPAEELGRRLRQLRKSREFSLTDASRMTGVPEATLSRIETNKMSPTFGMLYKIVEGLGFKWQDILTTSPRAPSAISISRLDSTATTRLADIPYGYSVLHQRNASGIVSLLLRVYATDLGDAGGLAGHEGTEFCYVLKGVLELHVKDKEPVTLSCGESALFDSSTPHAYVTPLPDVTEVLLVLTTQDATVKF